MEEPALDLLVKEAPGHDKVFVGAGASFHNLGLSVEETLPQYGNCFQDCRRHGNCSSSREEEMNKGWIGRIYHDA